MRRIYILRLQFISTRKLTIFYKNFKNSLKFVIIDNIRYLIIFLVLLRLKIRRNITLNEKSSNPQNYGEEEHTAKEIHGGEETPNPANNRSEEHATADNNLPVLVDKEVQTNIQNKLHKKTTEREQMPKNSVRFDGLNLNFDDPNEERKGFRCKLCGLQTNTYCLKCKVHLCFVRERAKDGNPRKVRNCHMNFHEINEC